MVLHRSAGAPLRSLNLFGCVGLTDAAMITLAGLADSLSELDLGQTAITDLGMAQLGNLRLEKLQLCRCKNITSEGMRPLQNMPLQYLNLSGTAINDLGLELLGQGECARTLRTLKLAYCMCVSGVGLAALPGRAALDVRGCRGVQVKLSASQTRAYQPLGVSQIKVSVSDKAFMNAVTSFSGVATISMYICYQSTQTKRQKYKIAVIILLAQVFFKENAFIATSNSDWKSQFRNSIANRGLVIATQDRLLVSFSSKASSTPSTHILDLISVIMEPAVEIISDFEVSMKLISEPKYAIVKLLSQAGCLGLETSMEDENKVTMGANERQSLVDEDSTTIEHGDLVRLQRNGAASFKFTGASPQENKNVAAPSNNQNGSQENCEFCEDVLLSSNLSFKEAQPEYYYLTVYDDDNKPLNRFGRIVCVVGHSAKRVRVEVQGMPLQEDTLLGWDLQKRKLGKAEDWSFKAQPKWLTRANYEIQQYAEKYYLQESRDEKEEILSRSQIIEQDKRPKGLCQWLTSRKGEKKLEREETSKQPSDCINLVDYFDTARTNGDDDSNYCLGNCLYKSYRDDEKLFTRSKPSRPEDHEPTKLLLNIVFTIPVNLSSLYIQAPPKQGLLKLFVGKLVVGNTQQPFDLTNRFKESAETFQLDTASFQNVKTLSLLFEKGPGDKTHIQINKILVWGQVQKPFDISIKRRLPEMLVSLSPYKGRVVDISLRLLAVDGMEFEAGTFDARFLLFMTWAPEEQLVKDWEAIENKLKDAKDEEWQEMKVKEEELAKVFEESLTKFEFPDAKKNAATYAKVILGGGQLTRQKLGALTLGDLEKSITSLAHCSACFEALQEAFHRDPAALQEEKNDLFEKKYWNAEREIELVNLIDEKEPAIPLLPPKLVQIKEAAYQKNKGAKYSVLSVRSMNCTISQIWALRSFPFDSQVLKFVFQPRESNDLYYLRKMRHKAFATAISPYVAEKLEEWTMVDEMTGMTATVQEHETTDDHSMNRPYSVFVVGIPMQRLSGFHLLNSGLSLFLLQVANFAVFFTHPVPIDSRLTYLVTLMLTTTALKYSLATTVPRCPYLTVAEGFSLFTILLQIVTMGIVVAIALFGDEATSEDLVKLLRKNVKKKFGILDADDVEYMDNIAYWTLLCIWFFFLSIFMFLARWYHLDGQGVLSGKHQITEFEEGWWRLRFMRKRRFFFCCRGRFCCRRTRPPNVLCNEDGMPWYLDQAFYSGKKVGLNLSKKTNLSFANKDYNEMVNSLPKGMLAFINEHTARNAKGAQHRQSVKYRAVQMNRLRSTSPV
eukprot:g8223.t1